MRHRLALFAFACCLAACEEPVTTAASITAIPGPPDAPGQTLTVLSGTKSAPVDSPSIRIQWWYTSGVKIAGTGLGTRTGAVATGTTIIAFDKIGSGDSTIKVGCSTLDSIPYTIAAIGKESYAMDTVTVHCTQRPN